MGFNLPLVARRRRQGASPLRAAGGGVLSESGNWDDAGAWSGSEDFDGTSGADLQVEINDWLTTQDSIDSRLDALEA